LLELKISTIQGRLAEGAHRTVACSHWLHLGFEIQLRIMVKELLFDDAYLSRVIDDMKLWFTRMEVLDLIYRQFFSTANSFGRQPTTSWYFQSLAPRTLALPAAAIHCVLSEYASGTKATGMFSQDAYRGTFGPSPVTEFSLEAIALSVTHQSAALYPPCGAHQFSSALHSVD